MERLKTRIPGAQVDHAMARFGEPLNNQRKRVKVAVVIVSWVHRVTDNIRASCAQHAKAVKFVILGNVVLPLSARVQVFVQESGNFFVLVVFQRSHSVH